MIYSAFLSASFLFATAGGLSQTGTIGCPDGYSLLGTTCYFVSQGPLSGASAEAFCQGHGGHAAVVETRQEMDLLKGSLLEQTVHLGVPVATSREQLYECSLRLNGHSGFTDFHTGEPDNAGGQDCVLADSSLNFAWKDVDCADAHHVLCKAEGAQQAPGCPAGSHQFEDSACFYVDSREKFSWTAALSACAERRMHLASVHSQAEQDFIWGLSGNHYLWFGLHDQVNEGDFIWSDGTAVNFTFWSGGQPDGGDAQDCTYMSSSQGGRWRDTGCYQAFGVACRGMLEN